jgi:nitrile hydratase accessory protein
VSGAEPVFAEPWEAQAFALAVTLQERGVITATEWSDALGAQIATGPAAASYYEHWLAALEALLDAKGLADADTLARCRDAWARAAARTPHGSPIELAPDDR